jgi:hypothetical protein
MAQTGLIRWAGWTAGIAISLMLSTLPALGASRVEPSANLNSDSRAQVQPVSQRLPIALEVAADVVSENVRSQPTAETSEEAVATGALWFFGLSCLAMGGSVLAWKKFFPTSAAQRRRDRKRSRPNPYDQNHNIQESNTDYNAGPSNNCGGGFGGGCP